MFSKLLILLWVAGTCVQRILYTSRLITVNIFELELIVFAKSNEKTKTNIVLVHLISVSWLSVMAQCHVRWFLLKL